jgi:diguanylate cyclase (GGDEF)-like protein
VWKIRARVLAGLAFIGTTNLAALGAVYPALIELREGRTWVLLGGMVLIGAIALWQAPRSGEWAFLLLNLALLVPIAVFVYQIATRSSGAVPEIALIDCCILPTLFCARLWHAVLAVLVTIAVAGGMAWLRLGDQGYAGLAVNGIVFITVFVCVVVRLLRHLALDTLAKAQLGEVTDPLTGLSNRRGLERFAVRNWTAPGQSQKSIILLVVDIDHFKQVNDTMGHAAGDDVIRRLGDLLRASSRDDDLAVRLGGEEFLLLLHAPLGQALAIADRLRVQIEKELYPITASIGGHEMVPDAQEDAPASLWRAVDIADRSLYEAKRAGRNCVVIASPAIIDDQ